MENKNLRKDWKGYDPNALDGNFMNKVVEAPGLKPDSPLLSPPTSEKHVEGEDANLLLNAMQTEEMLPLYPEENMEVEPVSVVTPSKEQVEKMEYVQQYLEAMDVQGPLNLSTSEDINQNLSAEDQQLPAPSLDASASNELTEEQKTWRTEGTITMKVEKLSELTNEKFSEPLYIRYLPWRIMTMVRNEKKGGKEIKCLSFFVQCNPESHSAWSCQATIVMKCLSNNPSVEAFSRQVKHVFTPRENDWGYSYFFPWSELMDPKNDFVRDDACLLEAHVKAEAPHGAAWDSKKLTGFVGLRNQGATCYMNSLLQALYFTNEFRRTVYKIPTEADHSVLSIALNLQKVFYNMQTASRSVGTTKLTRSFGWETVDLVMQHDTQEFLRLLLDRLEGTMRGTSLEGTIPRMFEGKMKSYVKCRDVNFESGKIETFYDIQLNIKGNKDIYDAFDDYIRPETLDEDNRYDAPGYGLQVADKGFIFVKFPPVLYLQLMRTQYDPVQNRNFKIVDRFEFFKEINLDRYLQAHEDTPASYKLHAVLVHTGVEAQAGHYVAYIDPVVNGHWYKFDDELVSESNIDEALEENFGGKDTGINSSCAYLLIYIRETAIRKVLADVKVTDIPIELLDRIKEDRRVEMVRKQEHLVPHKILVNVFFEETLEANQFNDLLDWEKGRFSVLKFLPGQPVKDLVELVAKLFNLKQSRFRIWPVFIHMEVSRPLRFDKEQQHDLPISALADSTNPWAIFIQVCAPDESTTFQPFDDKTEKLIFFKYYDPEVQRLMYLGCGAYSMSETFANLIPFVNKQLHFPPETEYIVYEEIGPFKLQRFISIQDTLEEALKDPRDGMCGNLLIFDKKVRPDIHKYEIPTVEKFYEYLPLKTEVQFLNKNDPNDHHGFIREMSYRTTYVEMAEKVAKELNISPKRLQFFSVKDNIPSMPFRFNSVSTWNLSDLLSYNKPNVNKFFFRRLTLDIDELERRTLYRFLWRSFNASDRNELVVYVETDKTVQSLREELQKQLIAEGLSSKKVRILEICNNKIKKIAHDDTPLSDFPSLSSSTALNPYYAVEDIPEDHLNLQMHEMLVPVFLFCRDSGQTFGMPFLIKIRQSETFVNVKAKIQKYLEASRQESENYKMMIVSTTGATYIEITSDLVNLDAFHTNYPGAAWTSIGLEFPGKTRKRSKATALPERALKMLGKE